MSLYDCDMPEFYSETFPVAARVHRCCECSAPIEIGEKHLYARGKNDGDFWYERQHMLCRELCMKLNDEDDYCCAFGAMKDVLQDGDYLPPWRADDRTRAIRALYARIRLRERAARRSAAAA